MAERVKTVFGHISPLSLGQLQLSQTSGLQSQLSVPQNHEYTVGGHLLNAEQRQFYEQNGFILIKKLVPKKEIAKYGEQFRKICDGEVYVPGMTVMKDVAIARTQAGDKGEKVITKVQDYQNDEVLFEYCSLPSVIEYVKEIIGPNCMAMHTMLINKPPDPGTKSSRHPMHQDLHYFPFRPANRIVCAWTAMERVHRDNGCLVVVPGTHQGELLEHGYPEWEGGVNKMYHGVKSYNPSMQRVWLEMDEGDTVFFHPILLHGSGTNRTSGFRKAISCHYAASECDYIDVKGTLQENIADEVLGIVAKKLGKEAAESVDFKDLWRFRSRLVAGKEINL